MPDYKKLYFELFRANAAAEILLAQAQQRAEAAILAAEEQPPITLWQGEKSDALPEK